MIFWLGTPVVAAGSDDRRLTVNYYKELAEAGSADAQLALGDIFANGEGVPQDLTEAFAWYYVAAQQGLEEAIRPMNDMLRAIPKDKWEAAKRRAEELERRFVQRKN